jgi:hypothetical protein
MNQTAFANAGNVLPVSRGQLQKFSAINAQIGDKGSEFRYGLRITMGAEWFQRPSLPDNKGIAV